MKAQEQIDSASGDGQRIGHQIRDLRKAKGLTLQTLADMVGRSVGYISQVERGVSKLPIPVLQQISDALGVRITWFFHSEVKQPLRELSHVVRHQSRRQLEYLGTGIKEELLSPNLSGDLLMILTRLSPLAKSDEQPRQRRGEEAGYVKSGILELKIGDNQFSLTEGDSFAIKANELHVIYNPSHTQDTEIVWVITPPNY